MSRLLITRRDRLPLLILLAGALASLLPLFSLTVYAFPSADDYCLAVEAIKGSWRMPWSMYQEWTGRYAASLLQATLSQWDLSGIYPWFCAATLAATILSFRAFIGTLYSGVSHVPVSIAATVATAVFVGGLPSLTEAFFWMASAATYQWGLIAYVLWVTLLIRITRREPHAGAVALRGAATVLTVLLPGFNEVMLPVVLMTIAGFAIVASCGALESRRFLWVLLGLAISLTAGSLLAPGNAIRSGTYPDIPTRHNFAFALIETARQMGRFLVRYGSHPPVWIFACATWWWAPRVVVPVVTTTRRFRYGGVWGVGLLLGIVGYLTLFPVYWEYGAHNFTGEGRTYNITYAVFSAVIVWIVWTLLSAASERWKGISGGVRVNRELVDCLLAAALAVVMVSSTGSTQALRALSVASEYRQQQHSRESMLQTSANGRSLVVVDPIRVRPEGLFWGDIQPDETHWINTCVAAYYGVGSVRTSPAELGNSRN